MYVRTKKRNQSEKKLAAPTTGFEFRSQQSCKKTKHRTGHMSDLSAGMEETVQADRRIAKAHKPASPTEPMSPDLVRDPVSEYKVGSS